MKINILKNRKLLVLMLSLSLMAGALTACGTKKAEPAEAEAVNTVVQTAEEESTSKESTTEESTNEESAAEESTNGESAVEESSVLTGVPSEFSDRDFDSTYSNEQVITLADGASKSDAAGVSIDGDVVTISQVGTYYLTGSLSNGQVVVEVLGENDKVQLVLDNVTIENESSAAIYVKEADKVFVTMVEGSVNKIVTSGNFVQIDENNIDGAIYSKGDIVFNGAGTLNVESSQGHGIVSKDDLKITSGNYVITASGDGLQGKDFVGIAGGELDITSGDDGIQSEGDVKIFSTAVQIVAGGGYVNAEEHYTDMAFGNMGGWGGKHQDGPAMGGNPDMSGEVNYDTDDDESLSDGSNHKGIKGLNVILTDSKIIIDSQDDAINADETVTLDGGQYSIYAGDDGIHGDHSVTVNGGTLEIAYCWEGLEGTEITINDGDVYIAAQDDGINAGQKVSGVTPVVEIYDGNITVDMAQGDTDALDSNGYIYIYGGTVNLNAQSPFDYDMGGSIEGGSVYVYGQQVSEMYSQFGMGHGGRGGR